MDQKYSHGATLPDFRVVQGGLQAGKGIIAKRASCNMVGVQFNELDQTEDECDSLNFFKEQSWVFA